ncbi:hypothetical protein GCM10023220_42640 [Streptomyces ziwulingensis]|uniref:Uncharacterized protein n=1 Tax=Streptomyces ziwulingensis TaxID=1045501 RepID=A0ABP9CBR1_9ACTN
MRSLALKVLVDAGGAAALGIADRHAVERLLRIKLKDQHPVKLPSEAGRWLAFPADRLDTVVSTLGLHDLQAITSTAGIAAATEFTDALKVEDAQAETQTVYRVYITPEITSWRAALDPEDDNVSTPRFTTWRLLWGNSYLDERDGFTLADRVSERCGEAHFYLTDPYNSAENWYVSRNGHPVRGFSTHAFPQFSGDPLPFEIEYRQDAVDEEEAEEYAQGVPYALTAADNLSIEPGSVLPRDTRGHGWLATTHPDLSNLHFKGALPL